MTDTAADLQIQLRDWTMGPVVHQYLALRELVADRSGNPVRDISVCEIHGLATQASEPDPSAINTFELGGGCNLHVYRIAGQLLPGTLNQVVASAGFAEQGSSEHQALSAVFERSFRDADEVLNGLGLRYVLTRQNSNTVARWVTDRILQLLDIERRVHPGLGFRRPGWNNRLALPILERDVPRGRSWPQKRLTAIHRFGS